MDNSKLIWFYWDGNISESRSTILKDSVYSTRIFNPNHSIKIISNTLTNDFFDKKYNIKVERFDESLFKNTPVSIDKAKKYMESDYRSLSDIIRLVLLYKFGGSYIDTDDLCINPLSSTPNIICRSYDPHTSFYNKIKDEDCVPGWTREIRGYDHINMFPRNDCWQNWERLHPFLYDILIDKKFQRSQEVVDICGEFSWQSITNETCKKWLHKHGKDWNFRLTLLYLYEDFVSGSSYWDRCNYGGEMCDLWSEFKDIEDYEWGSYKCSKKVAERFYRKIIEVYPSVSHMWLHSKDMKEEWIEKIDNRKKYSPSTWILNKVRQKINEY